MLGATDMYSKNQSPQYAGFVTDPLSYSAMSQNAKAIHLDPFHKLKSGFVTADLVEINSWQTAHVSLAAVETDHRILIVYDPSKHDGQYFILENRWGGDPASPNYDSNLPGPGIVAWLIVEDPILQTQFLPAGNFNSLDWGRTGARLIGPLTSTGSAIELNWGGRHIVEDPGHGERPGSRSLRGPRDRQAAVTVPVEWAPPPPESISAPS